MNRCVRNIRSCFKFFFLTIISLTITLVSQAQEDNVTDSISKAFYDTLKVRSERRKLTRMLYDMLIITPKAEEDPKEKLGSTKPFEEYEGLTIVKREIIRLNAFGSNIDNPLLYNPSKGDRLLNSTYIKTRQSVLDKYLLFSEGDTISALVMSDNERLLRELPFIEDVRIIIIPTLDNRADVAVIIREAYPLAFNLTFNDLTTGKITLMNKNFGGIGHELDITLPYEFEEYRYPGIGAKYAIKNIAHTFSNLEFDYSDGLGTTTMGGSFSRKFVSAETRYAWSGSVRVTYTSEDLDTMEVAEPLRYNLQDYWAARSVLLNRENVTRLILSARFLHNNVFARPDINGDSYYRLQDTKLLIGGLALSSQKFINTSLIYSFGRTEDIPYGYLFEADIGREDNEFKWRTYGGFKASYGNIFPRFGYLYGSVSLSGFYSDGETEQAMVQASLRYFTPLVQVGSAKLRAFLNVYYTKGYNRYSDEFLYLRNSNYIRGFKNDSITGDRRLVFSFEPVVFLRRPLYGFRFALFGFADAGLLFSDNTGIHYNASGFGLGIRIRNDILVFNTIQIRFGIYPNAPPYSQTSWFSIEGIPRMKPPGFEPLPPGVYTYN